MLLTHPIIGVPNDSNDLTPWDDNPSGGMICQVSKESSPRVEADKADLRPGRNHLGVSENSVPLNPMVNDHYPY